MKLQGEFVVRQVMDNIVAIPVGQTALRLNGMILLNDVSKVIWECLEQGTDIENIVKQIKTHNVEHLIITGEAATLRDLDTLLYEETALQPRIGTHDVWIKQGLENHPINSLLVGTLILGSCYRKEHPNTEPAKPIIPPNIKNKAKAFMDKLFT